MDWSFNIRPETIKLLVENICRPVFNIIWNKTLLDLLPKKKKQIIEKINQWDLKVKFAQSCPTLWDPMDYRVHGIPQARILELVAFPFSRGSSWPRNWTKVSCIAGRFFTNWAAFAQQRKSLTLWTYWMGENICKWLDRRKVNIQNI